MKNSQSVYRNFPVRITMLALALFTLPSVVDAAVIDYFTYATTSTDYTGTSLVVDALSENVYNGFIWTSNATTTLFSIDLPITRNATGEGDIPLYVQPFVASTSLNFNFQSGGWLASGDVCDETSDVRCDGADDYYYNGDGYTRILIEPPLAVRAGESFFFLLKAQDVTNQLNVYHNSVSKKSRNQWVTCTSPAGVCTPENRSAYFKLNGYENGSFDPFTSDTQTRFTGLTMSSSTNAITFDVSFFLASAEIDTTAGNRNPTWVFVEISTEDTANYDFHLVDTDLNSLDTVQSISTTFNGLVDGTYVMRASFSNPDCYLQTGFCPFPATRITNHFTVSGGEVDFFGTPTIVDSNGQGTIGSEDAPTVSNNEDILNNFINFLTNILQDKHPFAWPLMTLNAIQTAALTPQAYDDMTLTLPLGVAVTSATSSGGFLDFYAAQTYLSGVETDVDISPITSGCNFLDFSGAGAFDSCARFRDLTTYMLYLGLMWYLGALFYNLLPKNE